MTLTIELPPELERRLEEAAARHGQAPAEFVRAVVEEKLAVAPPQGSEAALALLRQWRQEDTENPEPHPPPVIPPLSLREIADPKEIDADVILAAQAEAIAATVATENVGHLARFVPARHWRDIPPPDRAPQ
jgi:hypothetical protein